MVLPSNIQESPLGHGPPLLPPLRIDSRNECKINELPNLVNISETRHIKMYGNNTTCIYVYFNTKPTRVILIPVLSTIS